MKNERTIASRLFRKIKGRISPIIDESDEYTDLLAGANAGWLERGNLHAISYSIKNLPSDAPIIEIGSFCGLSTNLITYYKEKHGRNNRLINCDKWVWNFEDRYIGNSAMTVKEYLSFALDAYKRNVRLFSRSDLPETIKEFSDDFFSLWRAGRQVEDIFGKSVTLGGPISFCFIDGNHDYDFAKRDFQNTDEFLESGGFILFDDSADGTEWEVARVREEVIRTNRYEIVMKNPNYLFRKK